MLSVSTPPLPISRYFESWQRHDTVLLRHTFTADATYLIKGKKLLAGIAEIEAYWRRNELRQHDLIVRYEILSTINCETQVLFLATFYDSEENQFQSIGGVINFTLTDDRSRISALTERYLKEVSDG